MSATTAEAEGEVLLADMGQCLPLEALSRQSQKQGTWMLYDYEAEGVQGTMVYGGAALNSPALQLPLPARGLYRIYLACWHDIYGAGTSLRLKLKQDRFYRQIDPETLGSKDLKQAGDELMAGEAPRQWGADSMSEVFWRVAELDGEVLTIDRVRTWLEPTIVAKASEHPACLAWVRLVPATRAEFDAYEGRGRTQKPRVQFAMYDNGGWWQSGCRSEDDIRASLDWFRDTDLTKINWGCYSNEGCCYPSKVGVQMGREPEVTRCIDEFFRRGVDPMRVACDYAAEIGLELYPSFRIGGKRPAPTLPTTNDMPFFDSHPHCLCIAEDGTPTPHYSFAYDEVRAFFVDLLVEAASNYDVPGVHFMFVRSNPFALYEEKSIEDFRGQHGKDPRTLPEDEPRWLQHRAQYLTQFIRQARRALDEVGRHKGRRVELSVSVPADTGLVPYWAVDSLPWAREGLVDYLILHAGGAMSLENVHWFREQLQGCKVPLVVDFYPRRMPARARFRRALEYYGAGADGFCFWDGQARVGRASEFAWSRFLGHADDLEDWVGLVGQDFREVKLRALQGYTLDRRYWTKTSG